MTEKCAWIINLGQDDGPAQLAAAQLAAYGLAPKGQKWPAGEDKAWMASAQEAAQQHAAVVVLVGPAVALADPAIRGELALFRLALQTQRGTPVNGLALLAGEPAAPVAAGTSRSDILDDWLVAVDARWPARAVARAHAPVAPRWPVRLGMHAHERLGAWLEVHPLPGQIAQGACVGVSGEGASIDFHAVGPAGALPERSVNEYELQGLQFDINGLAFDAWALQNTLAPDHSYFVRIEGRPRYLAIGTLPQGQLEDVHIVSLAP